MNFKTYHVRERNVGQTVAQMLRSIYAGKSWGETRKLISGRKVQINGNLCMDEARRLKAGELLRIYDDSLAKPAAQQDINIRYHDEHLVVVEKPAGVTTLRHPDEAGWDAKRKDLQPTMLELLQKIVDANGLSRLPGRGAGTSPREQITRKQAAARARSFKSKIKVRAVHRLDRDTSGLMMFALDVETEQGLVKLFAAHEIDRTYMAIVHGKVESRKIESVLVRDRGDGLRGSLPPGKSHPDAKHAVTHVTLIRHVGEAYSLIDCKLETGRTHQIRIHLSEVGHMLCGEKVYIRQMGQQPTPDTSGAPRHALHSHWLSFTHPISGKPHTFESKMPPDLHRWLKRLENGADEVEET